MSLLLCSRGREEPWTGRGENRRSQSPGWEVTGDTTDAGPAVASAAHWEGAPSPAWAPFLGWVVGDRPPPGTRPDSRGSARTVPHQSLCFVAASPTCRVRFFPSRGREAGALVLVDASVRTSKRGSALGGHSRANQKSRDTQHYDPTHGPHAHLAHCAVVSYRHSWGSHRTSVHARSASLSGGVSAGCTLGSGSRPIPEPHPHVRGRHCVPALFLLRESGWLLGARAAMSADSVLDRPPSFLPLLVSAGPGVPLLVGPGLGPFGARVLPSYLRMSTGEPSTLLPLSTARDSETRVSTGDVQGSRAAKVLAFLRSAWIGHSDRPLDFLCLRSPPAPARPSQN